jgi:hypothetical protein
MAGRFDGKGSLRALQAAQHCSAFGAAQGRWDKRLRAAERLLIKSAVGFVAPNDREVT